MGEIILDAFLDTLKLLPFLFILYILIELMEHNTGVGKPRRALTGKWAVPLGTGLGFIPMCGFSVMAAKLYQHRHITVGTLLAVFIATSDEALLVLLLSNMALAPKLIFVATLIGSKLILGIAAGYLFDALLRRHHGALAPLPEGHDHEHGHHVHESAHETHHHDHEEEHHDHDHAHEEEEHELGDCACDELSPCEHKKENKLSMYLVSPLLHALQVAAFVLLVNLVFGLLIGWLGAENVTNFMQGTAYWAQPVICSLIGMIPNCASSVILAEGFALGGIGFGGLLGGLVVNAGLGYLVLLKREHWKRGLCILAGMLAFGILVGYVASAVMLVL